MSGIGAKGLDNIMAAVDRMLDEFPEKRRSFHEKSGKIILDKVKANTPYDDSRKRKSHLRDGLYSKVGSKGGYVAVRADYSGRTTGHAVPHAHLVEEGHVLVGRDGKEHGFVKGKHMFEVGLKQSEGELMSIAEKFAEEVVGEFK
jgi:hypothetical protein